MSKKAERRRRAYYIRAFEDAAGGYTKRPPEWWRKVANLYPDLWEKWRDDILGKEKADALRKAHEEASRPEVGDELIVGVDGKDKKGLVLVASVAKDGSIGIAPNTWYNRSVLLVKRWFFRLRRFG